jgi:hypothetical protein
MAQYLVMICKVKEEVTNRTEVEDIHSIINKLNLSRSYVFLEKLKTIHFTRQTKEYITLDRPSILQRQR